jgi:hypothetical protein
VGEGEDRLGVENERPGREDWVEHELHGLLVFVTAGSSAIQAKSLSPAGSPFRLSDTAEIDLRIIHAVNSDLTLRSVH